MRAALALAKDDEPSLARAAASLEGQTIRSQLSVRFTADDGDRFALARTMIHDTERDQVVMKLKTTIDGETSDSEIRFLGEDRWWMNAGIVDLLPRGKRWIHGAGRSAEDTAAMSEYATFLARARDVENLGEAEIRGRAVIHYRGEVDVRELRGNNTARQIEHGGHTIVPIEAWVGDDDRPARFSVRGGDTLSFTIDILEYGTVLDVQPPPAAETIEQDEFDRLRSG